MKTFFYIFAASTLLAFTSARAQVNIDVIKLNGGSGTPTILQAAAGGGTITIPSGTATLLTTGNTSSITTLGTIGTGTWQGTAIAPKYGGTGIDASSAATGSIFYTTGTGTWSTLPSSNTVGQVLTVTSTNGGVGWQAASGSGNGFTWSELSDVASNNSITYYCIANGENDDSKEPASVVYKEETMPVACTLDAMYVTGVVDYSTGDAGYNGNGQTITATVYVNEVATSFQVGVTFAAAAAHGTIYSPAAHTGSISISAGDRIGLQISGTQLNGTQGLMDVSLHFH